MASEIYLDHNATTPPHPSVLAAMARADATAWANPASVHRAGQRARAELDAARAAVAALTGMHARDVVLTSGGTEANNLALSSSFARHEPGGLVTSSIEHPSVLKTTEVLAARGVAVVLVAARPDGAVDPEDVAKAIAALGSVRLVSLQAVNHETGVIQPVAAVGELARAAGALFHVDAVQAAGKLPPAAWQGADLLSVAAHKMRGPKGIGALVTRPHLTLEPLLRGGAQERGMRPGTQAAALAAGFAAAANRARDLPERYLGLAPLRDRLEAGVFALGDAAHIEVWRNGTAARAPHVANLSLAGWRGPELCAALDLEGVAVASGAACSAGTAEPSAVISAILGPERAASAIRISLGEDTTDAELDDALETFARVLSRPRG